MQNPEEYSRDCTSLRIFVQLQSIYLGQVCSEIKRRIATANVYISLLLVYYIMEARCGSTLKIRYSVFPFRQKGHIAGASSIPAPGKHLYRPYRYLSQFGGFCLCIVFTDSRNRSKSQQRPLSLRFVFFDLQYTVVKI